MESPKTELTRVGKTIREALDAAGNPASQLRAARAGLLDRVATRERRGTVRGRFGTALGRRWRALCGVGAFAAAGAATFIWMRMPISFEVGAAGVQGRLGDAVEATGAEAVALRFSEGSSIVLGRGSRLRVLGAEPTGARVLLESGTMDVDIVHRRRRGTRWTFEAGPFHALVTGTRFRVAWSPNEQSFRLAMNEGSVVVSGACLPESRTVSAGASVELACPRPAPSAVPAAAPLPLPGAASLDAPADVPAAAPPPAGPPSRLARDGDAWRALIDAGRLAEGLRAAERADFRRVCRIANERQLLALADAARLSGDTAHAREALTALRQRFPRSADAATAAFALGRIAFERNEAYDEAARWFATYLDELPQGPLMGDAIGRLMEARTRAGNRVGARADAERYLRRFPAGPYAPEARALLSE